MSSPQWNSFQPPIQQDSAIIALQNVPNPYSSTTTTTTTGSSSSSTTSSTGQRETGIIEKLLHSYGFIQCCERQARLFFHYTQFEGNIEHLKIGDPVEFEMTYDRRTGKPIASNVLKISSEVLSYEVLSEDHVSGIVTTEIKNSESGTISDQGRISYESRGECFFLPYTAQDIEDNVVLKAKDKVTFLIATDKRTGNLHARHIKLDNSSQLQRYQGVVCSKKESFGFIERADVVKEIFFHFSEVKDIKDLILGDDVEFSIQIRNNKEVAVNITRLPEGTVVFEDIGEERIKGQVTKVIDKGQTRNQSDPFPGRIHCRHSNKELDFPFGDKDQRGDFTLQIGDWVEFNIATDRRDLLQRATNIELLEESFLVSNEQREKGIIATLKEGFGFIKCVNREARMFFHFSEILDVLREIKVQDEVEFTVVQDATMPNRQNAIRIRHLPSGMVKFDTVLHKHVIGVVEKEPGYQWNRSPNKIDNSIKNKESEPGIIFFQLNGEKESINFYIKDCDIRNVPKLGDKVEFNICESKCNNLKTAADIRIVSRGVKNGYKYAYQGFIAALKDGFGFIETAEHDREVFFHFSVYNGDPSHLELGWEVEYGGLSQKGSKQSAECVRKLPKGTIPVEEAKPEIYEGLVVRPVRCFNPDQEEYSGLIQKGTEESESAIFYKFGITSLADKKEFIQKGDTVQFQLGTVLATGEERAVNVKPIRPKLRATVEAIKGQFGFLSYEVEEGKKLFFHISEIRNNETLQPGDQVEFVIVQKQRNGKVSACNVVKISDIPRPERLISRLRTTSCEESGPRVIIIRQPRGPDGTAGFKQQREFHEYQELVVG
uniref:Cold shock domain-containing protein E1 n=1 Tax=Scolopendra viridis TaxID=118503 RepID=A0A4D5R9V6_SCOVI